MYVCWFHQIVTRPKNDLMALTDDGRVDIKIDSSAWRLSRLFAPAIQSQLEGTDENLPQYTPLSEDAIGSPTPSLNVVIQIVGSRGDVQPFLSLGLTLKKFGHRVRLATHPTFQTFIEEQGLEFFSIGGDPAELMAFMVKNPGLIPSMDKVGRSAEKTENYERYSSWMLALVY